jgi:glycosyltransferase involved in cell wall biosynthesis
MGLDILLDALAIFIHENLNLKVTLSVVGTGRDEQRLKNLCQKLKLEKHVHFCGRVEESELQNLMLSHHGMIIPTREMEGFGMSVIEAWAAGLPVMATNAGALGEFSRHGEVIDIVGEPTVENIKSGLKWCCEHWMSSDDSVMNDLSQRCRDVATQHYSKDVIKEQLLNIYGTYRS